MSRYFALLPAAGSGARMGADQPKQYLQLLEHPMIWHTIRAFERHADIARIFVVIAADDRFWNAHDWSAFQRLEVLRVGGATRAESVLNGLAACERQVDTDDWILVHDAARPCISAKLLDKLKAALAGDAVGGILAAPVADTLKRDDAEQRIARTVSRERLWAAQTPQMFRYALLRQALVAAGNAVTDEASAVEALGLRPRLVESDRSNLKVTFADDLEMAAWILSR